MQAWCHASLPLASLSPLAPVSEGSDGDCRLWTGLRLWRLFNLGQLQTQRQCTFTRVTTFLKIITLQSDRHTLFSHLQT